jgi:hypothetical protein
MEESVQIIISDGTEDQSLGAGNSTHKIINPTLALRLPLRKTAMSFSVTILTYGFSFNESHKLSLSLINERKNDQSWHSDMSIPQLNVPDGGINFNFNVRNAIFDGPGDYTLAFKFDEKEYHQKFVAFYKE